MVSENRHLSIDKLVNAKFVHCLLISRSRICSMHATTLRRYFDPETKQWLSHWKTPASLCLNKAR